LTAVFTFKLEIANPSFSEYLTVID